MTCTTTGPCGVKSTSRSYETPGMSRRACANEAGARTSAAKAAAISDFPSTTRADRSARPGRSTGPLRVAYGLVGRNGDVDPAGPVIRGREAADRDPGEVEHAREP